MWQSDLNDGNYSNPILHADYSDPDVVRVGDDFFMTASSFTYSPGLPVLHSKDLVNWKVINYALQKMPYDRYNLPAHGCGVWAPAIKYHNGEYYIYFGAPDEGIIMVKTKDPFGKWEDPVIVAKAKGWIDTCPFWDDDGNAYLIRGVAKSRSGLKSQLFLHKMSPDGKTLLDDGVRVIDGRVHNPTLEGPKLYKRNGYYYIFAPAGGVEHGWQVVFRSKNIYGPYEQKIVLSQGDTTVNGPHQGGYVDTQTGENWFVHFQDIEAYGRIIHLQPLDWIDDWPLMGEKRNYDGLGQPVLKHKKPNVGKTYPIVVPETTDEFESEKLGLQWQWQANYKDEWYDLDARKSHLRLFSKKPAAGVISNVYELPNVLTQMFQMPVFTATAKAELMESELNDECGLIVTGNKYNYLSLIKTEAGNFIRFIKGNGKDGLPEERITSRKIDTDIIYFRVNIRNEHKELEEAIGQFSYSTDGKYFENFGQEFHASPGGWVGAKIGIYSTNFTNPKTEGYTDFDFVRIQ